MFIHSALINNLTYEDYTIYNKTKFFLYSTQIFCMFIYKKIKLNEDDLHSYMLSSMFCYLLFQKSHKTLQPMTKHHLIRIKEFLNWQGNQIIYMWSYSSKETNF